MENTEYVNEYLHELLAWGNTFHENIKQHLPNLEQEYGKEKIKDILSGINELITNIHTYQQNRSECDDISTLTSMADSIYKDWSNMEQVNERMEEEVSRQENHAVPIGKHSLPPLPYDYNALQPYIDKEIMRLHHSEHHQSYVDGLNKAETKMAEARQNGDFDLLKHWEREAAFNGAGHYLHTIFWNNMSPKGGGSPKGALSEQINQNFGSFKSFKQHFSEAANKVEGVGWALLVWAPRSHRLEILQAEKHQNLSQWDVVPLLVLDVWEHAYYLQYKNDRKRYVNNWWNIVNWDYVGQRFEQAKQLQWTPY